MRDEKERTRMVLDREGWRDQGENRISLSQKKYRSREVTHCRHSQKLLKREGRKEKGEEGEVGGRGKEASKSLFKIVLLAFFPLQQPRPSFRDSLRTRAPALPSTALSSPFKKNPLLSSPLPSPRSPSSKMTDALASSLASTSLLDPTLLGPLSPEVISKQATSEYMRSTFHCAFLT